VSLHLQLFNPWKKKKKNTLNCKGTKTFLPHLT
jgi:hypothetical protein